MCGITGWIDWHQDLTQQVFIVEKMANTLAKRGPDASKCMEFAPSITWSYTAYSCRSCRRYTADVNRKKQSYFYYSYIMESFIIQKKLERNY